MAFSKEIKQKVETFIRKGELKEVFKTLNKESLPFDIRGTLAIIEAEFNVLTQEETKGTIGFEEKQIRRNRINEKLIQLLQRHPKQEKSKRNWVIIGCISLFLVSAFFIYKWNANSSPKIEEEIYSCPDYDTQYKNKILIVPFNNLGEKKTNPEKTLRDKINQLSDENNLSTIAKKGAFKDIVTKADAQSLGEECGANIIVWGDYSLRDSLNIIIRYHFLEHEEWSNLGEKITINDITSMQDENVFKSLTDYIMSLCSVIAAMNGDKETASKWLNKIEHKDKMDNMLLEKIK